MTVAILVVAALISAFFPAVDFEVYYAAGQSLLSGRTDLYSSDFANGPVMDYRYPPVFLLLFLPFAALPKAVALFAWSTVLVSSCFAGFIALKRVSQPALDNAKGINWTFAIAALLTVKYVVLCLRYLNVHVLVVAFIFLAFVLWIKKKEMPAAFLMSLAVSIKVFPVLLLPYFVIKRQWRFVGMTACFVLMFTLSPAYYFGINENIDLHQQWFSKVVNESGHYDLNGPPNLSVQGQTTRFLTTVDYNARANDKSYVNVNVVDLEPGIAKLIGNVLAVIIGLSTLLVLFFLDRSRRNGVMAEESFLARFALPEFAFMICMMLLVGPRTNIIYFTAMFVPFLVLIAAFLKKRSGILWIGMIAATLASVVLPLIPGARTQRLFLVLGVDTIATLLVWACLGWLLIARTERTDQPEPAYLP